MSQAHELLKRITAELTDRGFQLYEWNYGRMVGTRDPDLDYPAGVKHIFAQETYRSNHTPENVTATITIEVTLNEHSSRTIFRVKVPKNASDRVLKNRVDKVLAEFQG